MSPPSTVPTLSASSCQPEAALHDAEGNSGYVLDVLRLVAEPYIDEEIMNSTVLNFIHHLKARCSPAPHPLVSECNPIPLNPISDVEMETIKNLIISLMINANSPKVQSQLIEAISVIGHHDLLPEIVTRLHNLSNADDYASINLLLATVDSLFMKFRCTVKTNDLLLDLRYCLDNFAKPLWRVFKRTESLIDQVVAREAAHSAIFKPCIEPQREAANYSILKPYIESQRLCCSIFYSLNFPEFCKDHMSEWMFEFKKYLTIVYPSHNDSSVVGRLLDELRVVVCENISMYVIKEEDLMQRYLSGFVEDVVNLLVSCSTLVNCREQMTVAAIKMLTAVSKSCHHALLSGDDIFKQISVSIVPNVAMQLEEKKLFERDPVEYIKRDMEGNGIETRRGAVIELLKGVAVHYKDKVWENVRNQLKNCWKSNDKEIAIRLIVSLATKNADDETCLSSDLVNVQYIFDTFVVNVLDMWPVASPMLKAGALKFLTVFRNQISKDRVSPVLPKLSHLLTSSSQVVYSYAAICIEKLLLVKDDDGATTRYTADDIHPIIQTLMRNLFFHILHGPKPEENQYVMKCVMRVVCIGDLTAAELASTCIALATIFDKVCQNPKSSEFNHYLFESLIALIRRVSIVSIKTRKNKRKDNDIRKLREKISLVSQLEKKLSPGLHMIWSRDIREFFPYAFRILAELADLNMPLLTPFYTDIFDTFHLPDTWTRSVEITSPASAKWSSTPKVKSSVAGIYNKLVSSSDIEDDGYCILNIVVENVGFDGISPFLRSVWISLFNRLQNQRKVKRIKSALVFTSLILLKYGPRNLVDSVNAVQPNGFQAILEQFWIPNLKLMTKARMEFILISVSSTRLICECADILDMRLWGKILDSVVTLFSQRVEDDKPEIPESGETILDLFGHLSLDEENPLKEIKDPMQILVASLSKLFATSDQCRKDYHQVISESLDQANQSALLQLFDSYNVSYF